MAFFLAKTDVHHHAGDREVRIVRSFPNPGYQVQPTFVQQEMCMDIFDAHDDSSEFPLGLIAIYFFSRYPYIAALRSKSVQHVAEALVSIFADRHVPHTVRSDLGKEFEGAVNDLCGFFWLDASQDCTPEFGVQRCCSIRQVNAVLQRYRLQDPTVEWSKVIPAVVDHLRTIVNSRTGYSPENWKASEVLSTAPLYRLMCCSRLTLSISH